MGDNGGGAVSELLNRMEAGESGIIADLGKPLTAEQIHWRPGAMTKDKKKAIAFPYMNSRDVMQRLDEVCGVLWSSRYPFVGCCEISIFVDGQWVTRSNGADETGIESVKGQYSDAFKRAATMWGIGRSLYEYPDRWHELDEWKKFTKQSVEQLHANYNKWLEWREEKGKV